jgi:hypothetical protein
MATPRRSLGLLIVLALGVAPSLSGCAATEAHPASAEPQSGFIDSFVEKLKREDDEAEVREFREHEPTKEELEEAREHSEQVQVEQAQVEQAQAREEQQS